MALTTCNECGKEISTDAKTCPHCGTPKPHKKKAAEYIGAGIIFIIFAIVFFYYFGDKPIQNSVKAKNELTKSSSDSEKPILTDQEYRICSLLIDDDARGMVDGRSDIKDLYKDIPIVLSMRLLQRAYEKNEVAADQKYKQKLVSVTGTIYSLDKTLGNSAVLRMNGASNMFIHPSAEMKDGYENWVASLSKGNSVKMVCAVKGMFVDSVYLDSCQPSYDWADTAAKQAIESLPNEIKNNNKAAFLMVLTTKIVMKVLKKDSKCFTNGTDEQCLDDIHTMLRQSDVELWVKNHPNEVQALKETYKGKI